MKTYLLAKTFISETEISLVMRQFLKVEKKFNGNFLALKVINHEPLESDKLKGADVECTCENAKKRHEETKEGSDCSCRSAVSLELICRMTT